MEHLDCPTSSVVSMNHAQTLGACQDPQGKFVKGTIQWDEPIDFSTIFGYEVALAEAAANMSQETLILTYF
eukprot:5050552-Amphidinium_carterae.1